MLEKKSIHGPNIIDITIADNSDEVVIIIDEPALMGPYWGSLGALLVRVRQYC